MNAAEKFVEKHYQELEAGLSPKELKGALQREGEALLAEQMEHIGAQFSVYQKLLAVVKNPAAQKSAKPIKLPKIENEYTRKRLEETIAVFGPERVYTAALRQQSAVISEHIIMELDGFINKIPLKELRDLFAKVREVGSGNFKFDYKIINDTELRQKFKKVVASYGIGFVLAESGTLQNLATTRKIKSTVWFSHGYDEQLKGYATVCAEFEKRANQRNPGRG